MFDEITKNKSSMEGSLAWPIIASILCILYSICFSALYLYIKTGKNLFDSSDSSNELYFALHFPIIFFGTLIYEFIVALIFRNKSLSQESRLIITLGLPLIIISVFLFLFIPFGIGFHM